MVAKRLKSSKGLISVWGWYCMSAKPTLNTAKVKVRSQKITKNVGHKHAVRHTFWSLFCTWKSKVVAIRLSHVIQPDFWQRPGYIIKSNLKSSCFWYEKYWHVLDSKFHRNAKYVIFFFLLYTPFIFAIKRMSSYLFRYIVH